MKRRRLVILGSVSVALAAVVSFGSGAGAAGSAASPSGVPVLLPASALAPTHRAGMRPPIGYLPLHAREFAAAKAAANARAGVRGKAGTTTAAGGAIVSSYENVSPSFDGIYQTDGTPPDTTGAIGPDRYIEAVNTSFGIFSRSGALLDSGDLSSLTGVPTGLFGYGLSDPQMMWDAKTQRFYYAAVYYDSLFFSDNGIALGFSKTATPTSAADFCQYVLGYGSELPDYPKLGDSADFLLFGSNNFGSFASTYDGSSFAIVNKPPAGATCPPTRASSPSHGSGVLHNADGSLAATPVPANLVDDANGAGYVVANADMSTTPSAAFVSVYAVTTVGVDANGIPVPAVSGPRNVSVAGYRCQRTRRNRTAPTSSTRLMAASKPRSPLSIPGMETRSASGRRMPSSAAAAPRSAGTRSTPTAARCFSRARPRALRSSIWNGAVSPDRANSGSERGVRRQHGDERQHVVGHELSGDPVRFEERNERPVDAHEPRPGERPEHRLQLQQFEPVPLGRLLGRKPRPGRDRDAARCGSANQYNLAGGTTSSTAWRTWLFGVTPTSTSPPPATLTFATPAQTLTAGQPSAPIQVGLTAAQSGDVAVSVASSSANGQFATSTAGPWSSTLQVTITAGQTASPAFYYRDTHAGSATLTASASGFTNVTQIETVVAAPLQTITVAPPNASLTVGSSQTFNASGTDAFGNPVSVAAANWTTTAPGTLSPTSGTTTTFTAASAGTGVVQAAIGPVSGSATVTVHRRPSRRRPASQRHYAASASRSRGNRSPEPLTYRIYRGTAPGGEGAEPIRQRPNDHLVQRRRPHQGNHLLLPSQRGHRERDGKQPFRGGLRQRAVARSDWRPCFTRRPLSREAPRPKYPRMSKVERAHPMRGHRRCMARSRGERMGRATVRECRLRGVPTTSYTVVS